LNVINGRQIVPGLRLFVERLAANGRDTGWTQGLGALGERVSYFGSTMAIYG
jgi:hypothetical protein